MTRNSIRGATLHLMDCSSAGWSWELSRSQSGCNLIDCLNSEKTEFLWCATSRRCPHLDTGELSVCGSLIRPVTVAHDLGVVLQSDLSMKDHVARTFSHCFHQLRLLKGCIKSLSFEAARAAGAAVLTSQ